MVKLIVKTQVAQW